MLLRLVGQSLRDRRRGIRRNPLTRTGRDNSFDAIVGNVHIITYRRYQDFVLRPRLSMIGRHAFAGLLCCVVPTLLMAEEPRVTSERLREAAQSGLPLVQQAAKRYPDNRQCFTCHHQTLPALAMVAAKVKGLPIDEEIFAQQ